MHDDTINDTDSFDSTIDMPEPKKEDCQSDFSSENGCSIFTDGSYRYNDNDSPDSVTSIFPI